MDAEANTTEDTASVAAQGATVAPQNASSKKGSSPKTGRPKAKQGAKRAAPKKPAKTTGRKTKTAKPAKDAAVPREFSKKSIVLELLRRPRGATLAELVQTTKWQAHSVRGFLSGTVAKKMNLPLVSGKREDGTRFYSLPK